MRSEREIERFDKFVGKDGAAFGIEVDIVGVDEAAVAPGDNGVFAAHSLAGVPEEDAGLSGGIALCGDHVGGSGERLDLSVDLVAAVADAHEEDVGVGVALADAVEDLDHY